MDDPQRAPAVLGLGAMLANRAVLASDQGWLWSDHHGDLRNPGACRALRSTVEAWLANPRQSILAFAHDRHPDFYSTRIAHELGAYYAVPVLAVQHHHAHVAAVVAKHRIGGPVLGLALDGFGWGADDTAWGGEVLLVHAHRWSRLAHLQRLPMPGGDQATLQPWRLALAWAHTRGAAPARLRRGPSTAQLRTPSEDPTGLPVGAPAWSADRAAVLHMLERDFNCPTTSSAGRWFDAMAAMLGLCSTQPNEVQAAQLLEAAAERYLAQLPVGAAPPGGYGSDRGHWVRGTESELPIGALVSELLDELAPAGPRSDQPASSRAASASEAQVNRAAAGFHLGLADGLVRSLASWARRCAVGQVCLSGGCLANRILRERLCAGLQRAGLQTWLMAHGEHGDASLALGQAFVARAWLSAWKAAGHPAADAPRPEGVLAAQCGTLALEADPQPWESLVESPRPEEHAQCASLYRPASLS